ncbi:MAG: hypothetical protein WCS73_07335 [Lentisphaeria bacterium]
MQNNDLEYTLDVLEVLSEALNVPRNLDESLEYITRMTCQLMETSQAAFLLLDEDHQDFIVRSAVGIKSPNIKIGYPLQIPKRLHDILWRLQNLHQINWFESEIEDIMFPIIAMPIHFKGQRIGHLVTGGAIDANKTKDPIRRKMFSLLAPFASLIIENAKATDLLTQRFVTSSQELLLDAQKNCGTTNCTEHIIVNTIRNPNKIVKLLAESFHRELSTAGFTPGQITIAAAQILDCVTHGEEKQRDKKPNANIDNQTTTVTNTDSNINTTTPQK